MHKWIKEKKDGEADRGEKNFDFVSWLSEVKNEHMNQVKSWALAT